MRVLLRHAAPALACALLLPLAACSDPVPQARHAAARPAASPAQFFAVDVEDADHGYAIRAARIGLPFVGLPELDDVEAAPGAEVTTATGCAPGLTSQRFEDPSDACWAAYASAMVRSDFVRAAAAVRTGCEKYRRADYCELLPELGGSARADASRKGEPL